MVGERVGRCALLSLSFEIPKSALLFFSSAVDLCHAMYTELLAKSRLYWVRFKFTTQLHTVRMISSNAIIAALLLMASSVKDEHYQKKHEGYVSTNHPWLRRQTK